ncbi:MAG: 50S ribosomal protein L32e [Candidatus Thorarchaeota archaeon]
MSKRLPLTDVPGVGPAMEEKLREAGIKTAYALSKADPAKLAEKVDGLGLASAENIIKAAQDLMPDETTPKTKAKEETPKADKPKAEKAKPKKEAKEETPKAKPKKEAEAEKPKAKPKKLEEPKAPEKKEAPKAKPSKVKEEKPTKPKKKAESEITGPAIDDRLFRLAQAKKKRKPKFRHEQAHRWVRISDRWRKVRGIDSATREKRKGRIAMVSAGYRSPKAVRGLHPSGYVEALVFRPTDLETLDPDVHAVRIASTVGMRKRQVILDKAESQMFRILNPSVPESVAEEDLFEELEGLDDLEVD